VADGEEHSNVGQGEHEWVVDEGVVLAEPDIVVHEEHEDDPQVPWDLRQEGLFLN
jgi:hypothetical protein